MTTAIRLENLYKTFNLRRGKKVHAVRNLNLEIEAGQIYGFLGPNGAGKTTTIRMMLDLIRPSSGNVYIFGQHMRREREVLQRIGSMVGGGSFYPFLTGEGNLKVLALTSNFDLPAARYEEVLDIVDMKERSARSVMGYSTGMRQRLGIAAALLTDPDLLILDEPTNGLDPNGIADMRSLIRRLATDFGKTVFLSSHLLSEVEQVCHRVAIINNGAIVREGAVNDLVAANPQARIRVNAPEQAVDLINAHWQSRATGDGWLVVDATEDELSNILTRLLQGNIKVYEAVAVQQSLEQFYLTVTGGKNHDEN